MNLYDLHNAEKSADYFGIHLPADFLRFLDQAIAFANQNGLPLAVLLEELLGLVRLEGYAARYQQTPPEFFPFGSNGSDGEHFGYIIHLDTALDYPAAYLGPMDFEGASFLGEHTLEMLQTLLTREPAYLEKYQGLITELGLTTTPGKPDYRQYQLQHKRPVPPPKDHWKWQETSDGVGIFAPSPLFQSSHVQLPAVKNLVTSPIDYFFELATENLKSNHWGSALYYFKEIYWENWMDAQVALTVLTNMQRIYEYLDREHLHRITGQMIHDLQH